ncbi:hypothetical protein [Palaeococcus ferrophilus]|uniref:hypothetical protein n=1 Tax=Palaeococcus ferrophilus TaxID=83868 RepID=UPI00064E1F16|nr:hypothetical protein [Palaeococcus ferrophilus]
MQFDWISTSGLIAILLLALHKTHQKTTLRQIPLKTVATYFLTSNTLMASLLLISYGIFGWPQNVINDLGRWPLLFSGAALFKISYDTIKDEMQT